MRRCSAACERNRDPILAVLRERIPAGSRVLEIGSGTGQHAAYMSRHLDSVVWQASDRGQNLDSIRAWLTEEGGEAPGPVELDVTDGTWPVASADAVFSANTAHIMHWPEVEAMFRGVGALLEPASPFLLYGPFQWDGVHVSESNLRFDASLRDEDPGMGIRDVRALESLAEGAGMVLEEEVSMPANNHTLVFRRLSA